MKVLGIDSSGLVASVAIVEDDVLIAEYTTDYKKTHSQTLLPMLDEICKMTEQDLNSIDLIAVAAGPGSFTGLRIGSATAKGLGFALHKEIAGVPTVDALAMNCYGSSAYVCPLMDARRSQAYTGIYVFEPVEKGLELDYRLQSVMEQSVLPIEEVVDAVNALPEDRTVVFLGDGVPVFSGYIREHMKKPFTFAKAPSNRQRAALVAQLGAIYKEEGKAVPAWEHVPEYLRPSQAERERAEKEQA